MLCYRKVLIVVCGGEEDPFILSLCPSATAAAYQLSSQSKAWHLLNIPSGVKNPSVKFNKVTVTTCKNPDICKDKSEKLLA